MLSQQFFGIVWGLSWLAFGTYFEEHFGGSFMKDLGCYFRHHLGVGLESRFRKFREPDF